MNAFKKRNKIMYQAGTVVFDSAVKGRKLGKRDINLA